MKHTHIMKYTHVMKQSQQQYKKHTNKKARPFEVNFFVLLKLVAVQVRFWYRHVEERR